MNKPQRISFFFLFLPLLFSGSVGPAVHRSAFRPHLVAHVQIVCHHNGKDMTRQYSQPHKIQPILQYMRLLKPKGTADTDPEQLIGDRFDITLYYSDGQRKIYRQRSNRYLSKNCAPWEKIDQDFAQHLYPMLQSIPSDD